MKKNEKFILIDADVISHFVSGGLITLLPTIFPYPIKILDKVYAEISRMPGRKTEVDNLLLFKLIEQIPFPEDNQRIKKEYHYIKNRLFNRKGNLLALKSRKIFIL
ncbi:hypothetical protein P872_20350 [Rhodonellum psychrophilum GCM71 = DSM 17998]|uniref:PIN domain-containing protein n=2 Tax=Rhodonellum TaxID=336827 RepID=U5BL29_9BACT|nr:MULTISPECIES: hypothetical protein [Rhodonellum]ERM81190.1 hypothetical protein P872_20350 [Rhodonellum psychrophilum GCM71 = DSM 17998]